jgi:hypothetical protein
MEDPMLRLRTRAADRPRRSEPPLPADSYVTDGARLFRVVAPLNPPQGVMNAVLEDCRTLTWHSYSADALWQARLRPAAAEGPPLGAFR